MLPDSLFVRRHESDILQSTVASYACLKSSEGIDPKQCKASIETLRLFLEQLEFLDDINCTGLLGLRRLLLNGRCSHKSCSHPSSYPAAFLWVLPFLQDQISLAIPSMGRGIAQLFRQTINTDDIELLTRLIPLTGDINSKRIIKWFSPAHKLAINIRRDGLRESGRYLVTHGLDLHVVLDDDFTDGLQHEDCTNNTPTSIAMRYSFSFFLFRKLLRDLNIDFTNFVEDELKQWPLVQAGWTQKTLLCLFEIDYTPLEMPIMKCRICHCDGVGIETSWLSMLESLKSMPDKTCNTTEIIEARDREIIRSHDMEVNVCYFCELREPKSTQELEEENSVFLIPL